MPVRHFGRLVNAMYPKVVRKHRKKMATPKGRAEAQKAKKKAVMHNRARKKRRK